MRACCSTSTSTNVISEANGDFTKATMLSLRDISDPSKVDDQPFDMRLVFRQADFANDIVIEDEDMFRYPSMVPVGSEYGEVTLWRHETQQVGHLIAQSELEFGRPRLDDCGVEIMRQDVSPTFYNQIEPGDSEKLFTFNSPASYKTPNPNAHVKR